MEEEESYKKPSYDGRQKFYDEIKDYMTAIRIGYNLNNYDHVIKNARGFYMIAHPFMNDHKQVLNLLTKAQRLFKTHQMFSGKGYAGVNDIYNDAINTLRTATDLLFNKSKYFLVPFSDEDAEEFDMQEFLKGCDLE